MMSWKIPSLEHPPAPRSPRLILWLFLMTVIGTIGFGVGIYLSENNMLPTNMGNISFILLFIVVPNLLIFSIRLLVYLLTSYHHQSFTDMLDDAQQEWRYWASKHLGLLAHSRITHIDEENKDEFKLLSLPPNKDNVLKLDGLKSRPSWEKQEQVILELLTPIAEYYHQYALTQPITFYWQAQKADTDWIALIEEEATRLSLNIESIQPLPQESLSEWLLALYEEPFEPKLYVIISCQLDDTRASEEASCLLLTPQELYEHLRVPAKAELLRPISTDIKSFDEALKILCEFQLAGSQLNAVWHNEVSDNNKGKCIESYAQQKVTRLSEHFYDVDLFLGKGGIARHGVALSLVSGEQYPLLIVHQNGNNLLLQQVLI
ncbi:hypothetical protein [Moellerella wisconsensis]|uniref:hypothetical protein n=1 Tax=Moellerella wisconsensis TaxID=158849 RepID=UPI000640CE6B|nr:hypothetical protein [Moellerella wisconsensis]KLN96955.1 hypothetical protein VK86_07360 [Moellerella wisconsensis]